MRQDGAEWHTDHFSVIYRALRPPDLVAALRHAGFALAGIHWHEPDESGFFQPIVTARSRESLVEGEPAIGDQLLAIVYARPAD